MSSSAKVIAISAASVVLFIGIGIGGRVVYEAGAASVQQDFDAYKLAQVKVNQDAQDRINAAEEKAAKAKAQVIVKWKTVDKKVIEYVKVPDDSKCNLSAKWMRIYNSAIEAANSQSGIDD